MSHLTVMNLCLSQELTYKRESAKTAATHLERKQEQGKRRAEENNRLKTEDSCASINSIKAQLTPEYGLVGVFPFFLTR